MLCAYYYSIRGASPCKIIGISSLKCDCFISKLYFIISYARFREQLGCCAPVRMPEWRGRHRDRVHAR